MKAIFKIILFSILVSATALAQPRKTNLDKLHLPWINFSWVGDSLGNKYFDKLAILLPIKIDNLPYTNLTAQFDLGADATLIYGNSISAYLKNYPQLLQKIDTGLSYNLDNKHKGRFIKGVNFKLDKVPFTGRGIAYIYGYGDDIPADSMNTASPKIVGTIAPDLFQNRVLIIDYPNKRICIVDSLPPVMAKKASFVPVKIRKGRIKIPFAVGGEEHDIMFDTGSSIFPIYTSSENSAFFTEPSLPVTDTIIGRSWGQKAAIYAKKISREVVLGKFKMPPAVVYYKIDKDEKTFEDEEKIIGLTGNAYFLNNVVIIDYKNKRFGIL